ncbi:MAG: hypothetical protein ACFFBL_05675 [Promethearchaeota archaeon]
MVNKEKAIKRELTRLRRTQNPEQIDFRRMRKVRAAKTKLFELRRKGTVAPVKEAPVEKKKKKVKPKKKPRKMKEKEPELEIVDQEPELEVFEEEPELEVLEEEPELEVVEEEAKPKKKPKKTKEQEPELEVIEEDDLQLDEISLEDLYTYDEEIDDEDAE